MLSYNVAIARESSLPTIASVIAAADADLVALQELDRFTQRSGPEVDQLARLGESLDVDARFLKTTDWDGGEFGLGLLLRRDWVVLRSWDTALPVVGSGEPRRYWVLEIDTDGPSDRDDEAAELRVWITHLSAYSAESRQAQVEALNEARLVLGATPGVPNLLLGDFNARPRSEVIDTLREQWRELAPLASDGVDYIFADLDWSATVLEARRLDESDHPAALTASDHPAIVLEFSE